MATMQRLLLKWRHSTKKCLTAALVSLWLCTFTLWHYREAMKHPPPSADALARTVVHDEVQRWHLDDAELPVLNPMSDTRWTSYPDHLLVRWTEPPPEATVPGAPGDMGSAVVVPPELEKEARRTSGLHMINLVASDLVPLNRSLPDHRNPTCGQISYPRRLPQVSVIVVFHNEAFSTLMRTVRSVIDRSPVELLSEVILVDDSSDIENLLKPLDDFVSALPVSVRVLRTGERIGLIRARLTGARAATSPVMVFLDAHVEVAPGWIVPMLAELVTDRTRVLLPVVDDVSYKDFRYIPQPRDHERGGLEWKLLHYWIGPPDEALPGQVETDAFPSATMIGCAFVVDREFFYASGSYDTEMKIWGGENVEMSVRVWRCGGSLLKVPCARIGHVYRTLSPHSLPGGIRAKADTVVTNTARFAEVWLDEYKSFYYYMNPAAKNVDLGDISKRKEIIDELKCHDFRWFLEHVYPEHSFPRKDDIYVGQIQEVGSGLCLDALSTRGPAGMRTCHGLGGFQSLVFSAREELRSASRCLEPDYYYSYETGAESDFVNVTFVTCDRSANQTWTLKQDGPPQKHQEGKLVHRESGLCLTFKQQEENKQGDKGRPKMILKYLASIVQDVARTIEAPTLEPCGSAVGQTWALNRAAEWREERNLGVAGGFGNEEREGGI